MNSIDLGLMIKSTRESRNLTQQQLAEALEISIRHLQGIENEGKTPSYSLLMRMLCYFGISLGDKEDHPSSDPQRELIHLLQHHCTPAEINVILDLTKSLISNRSK